MLVSFEVQIQYHNYFRPKQIRKKKSKLDIKNRNKILGFLWENRIRKKEGKRGEREREKPWWWIWTRTCRFNNNNQDISKFDWFNTSSTSAMPPLLLEQNQFYITYNWTELSPFQQMADALVSKFKFKFVLRY